MTLLYVRRSELDAHADGCRAISWEVEVVGCAGGVAAHEREQVLPPAGHARSGGDDEGLCAKDVRCEIRIEAELGRFSPRRAFGVLGPTVAAMAMVAFLASFFAAGWRPSSRSRGGGIAAGASGAAFMTEVLAQTADAFACRSFTHWPGALGWTINRLLLPAAPIELAFSLVVLFVAPIADEPGHAAAPLAGWTVAVASAAAVLGVDAIDKRQRARDTTSHRTGEAW